MLETIAAAVFPGLALKTAKLAVIAIAVAVLLAAIGGAIAWHDHNVVETHDARQVAATAKADQQADTHADEARRTDDNRLATETTELGKVQANANSSDLDRRLARMRCIKLQQSARASGSVAPACS